MDRFYELVRLEFEKELSTGGNYASKERLLAAFDRAFTRAMMTYAREKGITLI
jgi:hypothetical protein